MLTTSTINNSKLNNAFPNLYVPHYQPQKTDSTTTIAFSEQYHNLNYQSSTNDFEGDDSDISNEVNAELKITKIDKKLNKKSITITKVDKRRLQNRRSALKCRLRKA